MEQQLVHDCWTQRYLIDVSVNHLCYWYYHKNHLAVAVFIQLLEHKILFLLALSLWLVWLLEVFCGCSYLLCKFTRLLSTEIHQRFERIYFIFAILIIYWHHIQLLLTKLHILDVGESLSTR